MWREGRVANPSPEDPRSGSIGARAPAVPVVVVRLFLLVELGLLGGAPPGIDRVTHVSLLTDSVMYLHGRGVVTRSGSVIALSRASRGTQLSQGSVIPEADVALPAP